MLWISFLHFTLSFSFLTGWHCHIWAFVAGLPSRCNNWYGCLHKEATDCNMWPGQISEDMELWSLVSRPNKKNKSEKKNAAELVSNTYHNLPPVQNWRQEHLADDPMTPWFRHLCLFDCNHTTAELESRSNITLLLSVLRVMLNTTQSTCLFPLMIFF